MININVTNFRKNIYELLEQTVKFNEPVNVTTKDGNAVVLSEEVECSKLLSRKN